jgi:hypothetical protein
MVPVAIVYSWIIGFGADLANSDFHSPEHEMVRPQQL